MAGLQELEHLVEQPALRHLGQQGLGLQQRLGGLGVQREAQARELGAKAHGADDAHRVFAIAHGRVANHADALFLRVLHAAVVVHQHARLGVVVHGVDGEVAPRRVLLLRAPHVVAQHAPAGVHRVLHAGQLALGRALVAADVGGLRVVHVGAEGGDLDHLVLAPAAKHHVHDAKAPPDDEGAPEQLLDLLGRGAGGDVEILGLEPQQQIAHRAADDVGLVPRFLERAHHRDSALVHQVGVDGVRLRAQLHALAQALAGVAAGGLVDQLVDEGLDHDFSSLNSSSTRQPRARASARRRSSGLVATGRAARSSRGRSFMESE